MATATRTQRRYDHRPRDLVRSTQDIDCAIQRGVPRSTARSWLTEPNVQAVTADALNMGALQLQQELLRLRARLQKLIALLRVLLVVFRMSGSRIVGGENSPGKAQNVVAHSRATDLLSRCNSAVFCRNDQLCACSYDTCYAFAVLRRFEISVLAFVDQRTIMHCAQTRRPVVDPVVGPATTAAKGNQNHVIDSIRRDHAP